VNQRIDRILAESAQDNRVERETAQRVFHQILDSDGVLQHEINYDITSEESLWDDFCNDTEYQLI